MSSKADSLPFPIGRTYYQTMPTGELARDVAAVAAGAGSLKGGEFLGKIFEIEDRNYASTNTVKPLRSNARRKVMAVRNTSGATLHRMRLFTMDINGVLGITDADGYAFAAGVQRAYPSDEFLSASLGIPDDDVFWMVVEGPAKCLSGAAADGTEIISDGEAVIAKAGTSAVHADAGRVVAISQSATNLSAASHINLVGYALGATLTTQVDTAILINIRWHG